MTDPDEIDDATPALALLLAILTAKQEASND